MRVSGIEDVERVAGVVLVGSISIGVHAMPFLDFSVEADDRQRTKERDRDIVASMASSTDPTESLLSRAGEADGGLTRFCFCDRLVITDRGVIAIFDLDDLQVVGVGVSWTSMRGREVCWVME